MAPAPATIHEVMAWHPHIEVWLLMGAILAGYFAALRFWGPARAPEGRSATPRQQAFFVTGVLVLWVGAEWPIHELAERSSFSVHMIQHLLFSLVAPPLLLLGLPPWLLRALLGTGRVFRIVRAVTRPLPALLIFNAVIAVTHWPNLVQASLDSEPFHFVIHFVLVSSALLMWWPVVAPLPETARLSEPAKMLYLFLQSVVPTVPASFLTFASSPIYPGYDAFPHLWGFDTVTDQRVAGLIMKLGGGLLLWAVIAVLFFRWSAAEASEEVKEVPWDDFERELQAWDLRR